MPLNIHLILVGMTYKHLLTGILAYGNVDKIYLLHSDQTIDVAKHLKNKISEFGIDVFFRKINIFSVDDMVNSISQIAKIENNNNLFINITGGTNLMAGAACATSYFIGAQAYYIRDDRKMPPNSPKRDLLIELPVPNIRYNEVLDKQQLNLLQLISKRQGPSSSKLLRQEGLNISPQSLSYHLKQLSKKRLISVTVSEKDLRLKNLYITDVGKLVLSWSKG